MPEWLLALIITSGAGVACGLFAKLCPKEKLVSWVKAPAITAGKLTSRFLVLRLGAKAAESIEEGIIVTIATVIGQIPLFFVEGLIDDNNSKKGKKK